MKQFLFAGILMGSLSVGATTLYVDRANTDGTEGDGTSWDSATSFQQAMANAAEAEEAVEIRIKKGTMIVTARVAATVNQPLVIRGGYSGEAGDAITA